MLREEDVVSEGFRPLRKTTTEPIQLPSKPLMTRKISFNEETGEKESEHTMWEGTPWRKLEKSKGKQLERSNSFVGSRTRSSTLEKIQENVFPSAVAVVDPFSTGAHLAKKIVDLGFRCVRIFSIWDSPVAALIQEGINVEFDATLQYNDGLSDQDEATNEVVDQLKALPFNILAVIPGAETGVELADRLSFRLKLRSNGESGSLARRNKYLMGEKVRSAGVRAVKQQICTSVDQMQDFLLSLCRVHPVTKNADWSTLKCVLKPVQSAGTDDVFLCSTREEAKVAFERIYMKRNGVGLINDAVLVQEYLQGTEYVVDQVSRDGDHRLVCIWEYDKRSVNNAHFVYFGMKIVDPRQPKFAKLKAYADQILNALEIQQGPSHMEVKYNDTYQEPCLVEVGSRCHGGEGTWLPVVKECVGYSQVDITVDVYTNGNLFDSLNPNEYPIHKYGMDVDLVSRYSGIVRGFPGDSFIRSLESFRSVSWETKIGEFQSITKDCFTRPGCVQLVNVSEADLRRDFDDLHNKELDGLIDYSVITPNPPPVGAVVIVDAFSTGANIAAQVLKMGLKLILIFSEVDSPVAKLVSKSANFKAMVMIQHDSESDNHEKALNDTLLAIQKVGSPILAILPGAETGVQLAEVLAYRYGTRNNGDAFTASRRDKFLMQDRIRDSGLRSINQRHCYEEDEVIDFYTNLRNTGAMKCIVKPNASAGSDSVFLCRSEAEAVDAFRKIHENVNSLGHVNQGALVQEYLEGVEYVLDGVSRDGCYKVVAIWQYDKRSVNGSDFVYFGMKLLDGENSVVSSLFSYAEKVLRALEIKQGPSHMEIIMDSRGPCLVEVGSRCHGGEGTWIPVVQECIGYSQVEAMLNCYVRPDQYDLIPSVPRLVKHGMEAFLVSYQAGQVLDIPGIELLRDLPSFRRMEMMTQPGSALHCTIDCFTRPGSVQLVHEDLSQVIRDYEDIHRVELNQEFFVLA